MTAPALPGAEPTPFDAALAALDVEENLHPDRMEVTHTILGLDAVREAHRAEVDAAVARASTPTASNYLNVDALRERVEFLEKRDAAHRAEVERAVAEEREAIAALADEARPYLDRWSSTQRDYDEKCAVDDALTDLVAAIRARGVAKPRTGSEAPSDSDEGAKS